MDVCWTKHFSCSNVWNNPTETCSIYQFVDAPGWKWGGVVPFATPFCFERVLHGFRVFSFGHWHRGMNDPNQMNKPFCWHERPCLKEALWALQWMYPLNITRTYPNKFDYPQTSLITPKQVWLPLIIVQTPPKRSSLPTIHFQGQAVSFSKSVTRYMKKLSSWIQAKCFFRIVVVSTACRKSHMSWLLFGLLSLSCWHGRALP